MWYNIQNPLGTFNAFSCLITYAVCYCGLSVLLCFHFSDKIQGETDEGNGHSRLWKKILKYTLPSIDWNSPLFPRDYNVSTPSIRILREWKRIKPSTMRTLMLNVFFAWILVFLVHFVLNPPFVSVKVEQQLITTTEAALKNTTLSPVNNTTGTFMSTTAITDEFTYTELIHSICFVPTRLLFSFVMFTLWYVALHSFIHSQSNNIGSHAAVWRAKLVMFHSIHHQHSCSIPCTALHYHPIDMILLITFPLLIPSILLKLELVENIMWFSFMAFYQTMLHSGHLMMSNGKNNNNGRWLTLLSPVFLLNHAIIEHDKHHFRQHSSSS